MRMPKAPLQTEKSEAPTQSELVTPDSYESALAELESLVARIDAGELPLNQLLVNYQRGAFLLQFCRDQLAAVETQIKLLEDGQLKPWEGA